MMHRSIFCLAIMMVFCALSTIACNESNDTVDGDSDVTDGDDSGNIDGDIPDGDDDEPEQEEPSCYMPDEIPQDEVDLGLKKFALSMFHYNIQYVAGGFEVEINGEKESFCGAACDGWTDERLMDWIVEESFEPVLDFYIAHPQWKVSFEMQGMMLEHIAAYFPAVLEKLRDAAQSGQVELISFHYSAQLFIAFPKLDLQRSVGITRDIFEENCVPLSEVVFNQEGQAGEGKHAFMAEHGYSISVFPKNLYAYVRHQEERWPYYKDHGVDVVIGPGGADPESGIDLQWVFFDDGELLTTPADPYFAFAVSANPEKLEEYEEKLQALEDEGYKITSITDYVNHLKGQDVEQRPLPKVIDGTWQPRSTSSVLRWMGGRSLAPYNNLERDNAIRSENYRVRTELEAAEILVAEVEANEIDVSEYRENISSAWRHLLKAEVTDATGITPWIGEFMYAVNNNAQALTIAQEAIGGAISDLGWPHAQIDLEADDAAMIEDIPIPEAPEEVEAKLEIVIDAPSRTTTEHWFALQDKVFELQVTFGPGEDPTGKDVDNTAVHIDFPRFEDKLKYSPALMDDTVVDYDFSLFNFEKPEVYLPLANGLIGLGNGWWLVKDCRNVHLAPRIPNVEGESIVQFIDETADPVEPITWRFFVLESMDEQEALAFAKKTNTAPVLYR